MIYERRIRRYAGYYRGWCQAFGEHEMDETMDREAAGSVQWLFGHHRIGLILPDEIRKFFLREFIGKNKARSVITFSRSSPAITVNESVCPVLSSDMEIGVERLMTLVEQHHEIHLFLTHHLCYPQGTRIITFSANKPFVILYKEIDPLVLRIF